MFHKRKERSESLNFSQGNHAVRVIQSDKETGPLQEEVHETKDNLTDSGSCFHNVAHISYMSRSVLDLGLQPTKCAKAQVFRRQRSSEDQIKVQTANQIKSAQQLQLFSSPLSSPYEGLAKHLTEGPGGHARDIARGVSRMKIYKSCQERFESADSTTF